MTTSEDLQPLVSVVVPTKNSSELIAKCLESIRTQSYQKIELIVVDNYSTDNTVEIARQFTEKIFSYGPERSAQINHGAAHAEGDFIYRVDSDFLLHPGVIEECVNLAQRGADAVVVHNTPDEAVSLLARVRKFEVDMYKYDLTHSSARFVRSAVYREISGLDESITAGEDYDFQNRLTRAGYVVAFADAEAVHLDEPKHLLPVLRKYYYYGQDFHHYRSKNIRESKSQLAFLRPVYWQHWRDFGKHPGMATLFCGYHLLKFLSAGTGFAVQIMRKRTKHSEVCD